MRKSPHERYLEWGQPGESYADWLTKSIRYRKMWIGVSQADIEELKLNIKRNQSEMALCEAELAKEALKRDCQGNETVTN